MNKEAGSPIGAQEYRMSATDAILQDQNPQIETNTATEKPKAKNKFWKRAITGTAITLALAGQVDIGDTRGNYGRGRQDSGGGFGCSPLALILGGAAVGTAAGVAIGAGVRREVPVVAVPLVPYGVPGYGYEQPIIPRNAQTCYPHFEKRLITDPKTGENHWVTDTNTAKMVCDGEITTVGPTVPIPPTHHIRP